jgi:hypothetical protein
MSIRSAASTLLAGLLGVGLAGIACADRPGHAGRFAASGSVHGAGHASGFRSAGPRHFGGRHFHHRVFIGGTVFAPLFYFPPPPSYYYPAPPVEYIEPYPAPPVPQPSYWYYCPGSAAYYPYVRECPGGWQQVMPQPPS